MNDTPSHKGRIQPGEVRNPHGKVRGTKSRVQTALDAMGAEAARDIWAACLSDALSDNLALRAPAQRMALDRILPVRRGRVVFLPDMPPIRCAADLIPALAFVIDAMSHGVLTPEETLVIAQVFEVQRAAVVTQDVAAELAWMKAELEKFRGKG